MMFVARFAVIVPLFALGTYGLRQKDGQAFLSSSASEMEAEESSFWKSEWDATESALLQLQVIAANMSANVTKVSVANATEAPKMVAKVVAQSNKTSTHHHDHDSVQAKEAKALAGINLNPKSLADLAPTLAMLKGMYEDSRDRITALNKREKKSKVDYETKKTTHNARIDRINAKGKNHTLSDAFLKNETHDEDRLWAYWEKVRERQTRQFHTSLKIQHGMMNKVKMMMDMYEKTMKGGAEAQKVKKDLIRVEGGAPEIVFLQQAWGEISSFCQDSLQEVSAMRKSSQGGAIASKHLI